MPCVLYNSGSSGYSTGFLRAYYSFDETMRLALDGIHAYKNWARYTKLDNPEVYFTHTGALWMLGYQKQQNVEMQVLPGPVGSWSPILVLKLSEKCASEFCLLLAPNVALCFCIFPRCLDLYPCTPCIPDRDAWHSSGWRAKF